MTTPIMKRYIIAILCLATVGIAGLLAAATTFAALPSVSDAPVSSKAQPAAPLLTDTPTLTPFLTQTPLPTVTPYTTTPTPFTCEPNYTYTTSLGNAIVPGTTVINASRCDDCSVIINMPFSYTFYDGSYASLTASWP